MSGQHTQGRPTYQNFTDSSDLEREDGEAIAGCMTEPDARRLAACWNAFDGVRTEMVEAAAQEGGMERACNALSELPAIEANYEAARALLAEVLTTEDAGTFERIRAFLKGQP